MLKVKQKVVVKGGFGSEKPVRVRIDAISTKNDREIIEYTDWDGQDRWAYVSQIIDFNPDGEPVEPSKPTCDKCGKFTDEREGQFTVCGTAWVCPSCKTELDEMDEEPTVKPPTNFDVIESLDFIWDKLHGYREDCIPESNPDYDEEWSDICISMAWIEGGCDVERKEGVLEPKEDRLSLVSSWLKDLRDGTEHDECPVHTYGIDESDGGECTQDKYNWAIDILEDK